MIFISQLLYRENDSTSLTDHNDFDVFTLMQCNLPTYVMKCLLQSGYDEKDVIQAMDTMENEGNSISMIE